MSLSLTWQHGLHFKSGPGGPPIEFESSDPNVLSPMQALAHAVMACMSMDVVHILQKGRHDLRGLTVSFEGERAPEPPKRYTTMHLRFELTGDVPEEVVTRALALSHEKYCSVWHSLRKDVVLTTSVTIRP